ncbi:transporter substrate-binding domain-containing protein [Burkholderiaceae bacterium DAT-1]|nr:transporter substrate-binding domain-containing protein [Burkholderiaceae bacterium DAT-1]
MKVIASIALLMLVSGSPVYALCSKTLQAAFMVRSVARQQADVRKEPDLDTLLMRRIISEAGCSLHFHNDIPPRRQVLYIESGQLDIVPDASETPERLRFARFTKPYRRESIVLFARKGEPSIRRLKSISDLIDEKVTVIVPAHGWYGAEFDQIRPMLKQQNRLTEYVNIDQALAMLEQRRGDILLADTVLVREAARRESVPLPVELPVVVNEDQVRLMLSKQTTTQQDIEILNQAIDRLDRRGELKRIFRDYFARPSQVPTLKSTTH